MNEKNTVINGFFWRFLERCGAQGVTFLVSVVLARLLDPAVYGTVALVTVFTTILQVFVDSGLGNALIQKKDADDLDFSTVFYFNVVLCVTLYTGMFFAAPLIAKFYDIPTLTPIVRVLSLVLVISGVKNVQQAYVSRHMLFRKFFFATLGGTLGAAGVGIYLAWKGYGVWALVAQHLFNTLVDTIILWITVKWRPKLAFSFARLKGLFSYGWKLLVSKLIDTLFGELRQLVIGKVYTESDLAFYNKANQFPHLIVTNINTTIDSVLFPTMSKAQESIERVRVMTRRAIKTSTYIMMPAMMGLAVCADPIIRLVLTEKWLPCVVFMRIFCFAYAFQPVHTANLNAIKALGRSDLFLKLEIIKKIVSLTALLITMWISVKAMAYSLLVISVLSQIINSFPNRKLLNYSYLNQLKDMLPQIGLSCVMGACVYAVTFLPFHPWVELAIQVPLGIAIYLLGSKLFHFESLQFITEMIKGYIPHLFKRKRKAETEE